MGVHMRQLCRVLIFRNHELDARRAPVRMSEDQPLDIAFMGPAALSPSPSGGGFSILPQLVSSQTSKMIYREQIQGWIKMVFKVPDWNPRAEGLLEGTKPLIYGMRLQCPVYCTEGRN